MVYIPRSKISKKQTSSDNVLYMKTTGVAYKGPFIETSDGRFFAGHSHTVIGPELVKNPLKDDKPSTPKLFSNSKASRKYQNLRNDIKKRLEKSTSVPIKKPTPSLMEYRMGKFQRYFFKRINEIYYQETDKEAYEALLEKKPIYDHNLYDIGTLMWYIRGNGVFKQNALSIKKSETKYPFIKYLFPVLNEYQLVEAKTQNNLHTNGGELYYSNGKEYIGPYHIHPSKGPMVGAEHTEAPHDNLYYTNQLPEIPNQSYEEWNQNYQKVICYKCLGNRVVSFKISRFIGCENKEDKGTFTSYEDAVNSCSAEENGNGGRNSSSNNENGTSNGEGGGY